MILDADLNSRIRHELNLLRHARKRYVSRMETLQDCKGVILRRTKPSKSKHFYYSIKRPGSKTYSYLGSSGNRTVRQVREVRFLQKAIEHIDKDIKLLTALDEDFLPYDPGSVSQALPKVYRCEIPPISEAYERESKKWMAKRLEFQKRFPENYPENKTFETSDKVKVKSLSEVVIYERFKAAGFAQIYELPFLPSDHGPAMYPDDTILSPVDLKTEIIVEYFGMMDLMNYRGGFAKKVGRYIESGYIPGVNLFFIFSDKNGHIDSMQITRVIEDILGLRN